MDGTLRSRRLATVVLLLLCAAPAGVEAQPFVCQPIVSGDTAAGLARRLTGNAAAAYTHAFQIRDPARQMFVPKSHYLHLSTDWQACVATGRLKSIPSAYAPDVALATPAAAPPPESVTTSALLAVEPVRSGPAHSKGTQDRFVFIAEIASAV